MAIKKVLALLAMTILMATAVLGAGYKVWSDTFTDTNGLANVSDFCAESKTTFGVIQWTDGSTNTTNCVDKIQCRYKSTSTSSWSSYGAVSASGTDLATPATCIDCRWNLTPTSMGEENCTVSGLKVAYSGFASDYGGSDIATSGIDALVTIVATLVGLGAIIGIIVIIKWIGFKPKI